MQGFWVQDLGRDEPKLQPGRALQSLMSTSMDDTSVS